MASNLIAIQVEGVLRKLHGGAPIQEGKDLYYGLATRAKIVLLTSAFKERFDGKELRTWLEIEGMYEHVDIKYCQAFFDNYVLSQVAELQGRPGLVVVSDPGTAKELLVQGVSSLLFTHAQYADPAWRPDAPEFELESWDSLAQQVATEAYLKANEDRKDAA